MEDAFLIAGMAVGFFFLAVGALLLALGWTKEVPAKNKPVDTEPETWPPEPKFIEQQDGSKLYVLPAYSGPITDEEMARVKEFFSKENAGILDDSEE